ncbi:MAG: TonB-dependent receptor, partial [Chitinophagales bacterium]|nr:TonB-dependent receptor [Chitinophagales bacterium]
VNNKNSFKTGLSLEKYYYNHLDSNLNFQTDQFEQRYNYNDDANLLQAYFQWKYKANDKLTLTAGLHGQIFTMNKNSKALEPRAGLKYALTEKSGLSFGVGLHSQQLPGYQYTYQQLQPDGTYSFINKDVGFIRSLHTVAGYDQSLTNNFHLKTEIYYQYLFDVPVEINPSAFSLANEGSGFSRFFPDSLQNSGTAKNYGLELTLEKFFSNHFFFLITGSLYDSRYVGSDGVERKTDFNGTFASNFLGGYEFTFDERNVWSIGTKITYAGGKLTTPVDEEATLSAKELVFIDSLTNTIRLKDYFRMDIKTSYRINSKKNKVTHEFALDLVNVLGIQNVLGLTYAPDPSDPGASPVKEEYQLGFLPLFYYKIDF